jgi:hypothetical protein
MSKENSVGFAIGNGLSREDFDLNRLRGNGISIACNYIYNIWEPDYLVTLDNEANTEIQELVDYDWPRDWKWISRRKRDDAEWRMWQTLEGVIERPIIDINKGYNNNSGVMAAAYLSEILKAETVYMLGMDFFLQVSDRDNDVFAGNTYFASGIVNVWNMLAEGNPQTEFIRVGPIADKDKEICYDKLKGFKFIDYDEFPY